VRTKGRPFLQQQTGGLKNEFKRKKGRKTKTQFEKVLIETKSEIRISVLHRTQQHDATGTLARIKVNRGGETNAVT